jgi:pyruvate kinase
MTWFSVSRWTDLFRNRKPSAPLVDHGKVMIARAPRPLNFHVTLWPAFPHFDRFAQDRRLQGIRLNSAMMEASEIEDDFLHHCMKAEIPLWFDIKAMQLRIREIVCGMDCDHLEFILNRPVRVKTPCRVWFKAGEDSALLKEIKDGTHFIFEGGPKFEVRAGESIHIRQPEMEVGGDVFLDYELEKIQKVVEMGFNRFYLSYVYHQDHVDAFRELIGPDARLILKIENKEGLAWVANRYKTMPHTHLMAARGDLFIEIDRPHEIMAATKLIIEKDPDGFVGSRMLLSLCHQDVPSCADFSDLAWLYDIGCRNFLLCDELCLKEELLSRCVNVFNAFRKDYQ